MEPKDSTSKVSRFEELAAWAAAGRVESPVEYVELALLSLDAALSQPAATWPGRATYDSMVLEDVRLRLDDVLQRVGQPLLPQPPPLSIRQRDLHAQEPAPEPAPAAVDVGDDGACMEVA